MKYQSGAVLAISLIMLLLLTLISATGMSVNSLEEKMAGNMRDRNLAFQAAESALNAGELAAATAAPTITCPGGGNPVGYYLPMDENCDGAKETTPVWENAAIWSDDTKSVKYDTDGNDTTVDLTSLNANPHYVIEDLGKICTTNASPCPASDQRQTYRITSRAVGGSANTVVMLQSVFQL